MRPQCRGFLILLVAVFFAAPVLAGEPVAGRYLLGPSPSGFVRLDTATGSTSHCRQEGAVWRCEPLLPGGNVIDDRLEALSSEVTRLSAALAALNARVAALVPVDRRAIAAPPAIESPPIARTQGFAGQLVERFLDLVRTLKHGRAGLA